MLLHCLLYPSPISLSLVANCSRRFAIDVRKSSFNRQTTDQLDKSLHLLGPLFFQSAMAVSHTTCYQSSNSSNTDSIYKSNYLPCNSPSSTGFVSCCFEGHLCGLDGFCHFSSMLVGTSGYYLGGCTDPTYNDPSCVSQCGRPFIYISAVGTNCI